MKMKGLIFKELYLGRKNYLLMTAIWFMLSVLGILIRLSMLYGNLANIPTITSDGTDLIIFYTFMYAPAFVLFLSINFNIDIIASDFASKWSDFSYTTPISEYGYAGIRYMLKAALCVITFALSLANAGIMSGLYGKELNIVTVNVLLVTLLFVIIISVIAEVLMYRCRSKNKVQAILIAGAFIFAGLVGLILFMLAKNFMLVETFKNGIGIPEIAAVIESLISTLYIPHGVFSAVCSVAIIAALTAGYRLNAKAIGRREK